ncbi:33581_t:CDS:2, partial [Racocetra persica]
QDVDNRIAVKLNSKKVSYSCSFGFCKKALDLAITNSKRHLAGKRYLSTIENRNSKYIHSSNQDERLEP